MRKIKILFAFSIFIIVAYFLGSILNTIMFFIESPITKDLHKEDIIFGSYSFLATTILSYIIILGIFFCSKCLYKIIKNGYFTVASNQLMKTAGYIFLSMGILSMVLDLIRFLNNSNKELFTSHISLDIMLFIFGFIVLSIADMVQVGFKLKYENDLTI